MIIKNNEELLRRECEPVTLEEVGYLIDLLEKELSNSNRLGNSGIGLAAPQIGVYKKIAIIRINSTKLNLVNCEIIKCYDKTIIKNEGCLSFPSLNVDTYRYQEIYASNNLVEPYSFIATGLISVAVQHELDHINSVLFMDRAVPNTIVPVKNNKIGPNDICLCGSNKKYKKCCMQRH